MAKDRGGTPPPGALDKAVICSTRHPGLYPPRERSENVALIRGLINASTAEELRAADDRVARSLHPSLFAELDWMELVIPAAQREKAVELVDGVFQYHLAAIVAQRRIELEGPDEALAFEVDNHRRFYDFVLEERPDVVAAWGSGIEERIRRCLAGPAREAAQVIGDWAELEQPTVDQVRAVQDRACLAPLIDVVIQNCLAHALDHVASRLDAKALVRASGWRLPTVDLGEAASPRDLIGAIEQLRDLAADAGQFGVLHVAAVCRALADVLGSLDPAALDRYGGERAAGYGPCGACAMMYASSAIVSLDPTCPGVFDDERGRIHLSLDLNVSRCPFCLARKRVESPAMFHAPQRNQVIYNVPTLGQYSTLEALDVHRPMLVDLRDRYRQRLGPAEALAFEQANEEFTHEMVDFLLAIQLGTTAREDHISLLVRTVLDGSGMIVDPTKGVFVHLTPEEMQARWNEELAGPVVPSASVGSTGPSVIEAAQAAFVQGDHEVARQLLEQAHADHPGDDAVRRNLAVVYHTLGQVERARAVLQEADRTSRG